MAGWFITFLVFGALFLVVGIPALLVTRGNSENRAIGTAVFVVLLGLTGLSFFLSSFKIVGAKDIGVPVTFGRPDCGTATDSHLMHNGWNWKAPATAVHIFDGALQTEKFSTDKDDQGDPIAVRLFTGSVAHVNVTFQWKLENDQNVCQVYNNYREPDKINTNLVKRALQQSLGDVYSAYNPYAALISAQTSGNTNTPGTQQVSATPQTTEDLQTTALDKLKKELAPQGVSAVSLTLGTIEYDQKTQDNLNSLGNAITQTQIALQNEKTADATAQANKLLNAQPATNETIQQLCIQATQKILEDGHQLPAGWNCFGSSNVLNSAK